jgi:hypothetical protein
MTPILPEKKNPIKALTGNQSGHPRGRMSALRLTWDIFSIAIQVEIVSARIAESGCPLWGVCDALRTLC